MKPKCPNCGFDNVPLFDVYDIDLPPSHRTLCNLWIAEYHVMHRELIKANKGIKRLKQKLLREKEYEK